MNEIGTRRKNRDEAGLQDVKKYPYYTTIHEHEI